MSVVAVAASVLGLAGCGPEKPDTSDGDRSNERPPTEVLGMQVDPAHLQGPGTELGDGLEVAEGSWLVGTTFPLVRPPEADLADGGIDNGTTSTPSPGAAAAEPKLDGWIAWILVSGDPIDVWTRYVDQLGLGDKASATKACVVRGPLPDDGAPQSERVLTEPRLEHEVSIECSSDLAPSSGPTERSVRLNLVHGVDGYGSCPGAWAYTSPKYEGPPCRGGTSFMEITVGPGGTEAGSPLLGESSWTSRQMALLNPDETGMRFADPRVFPLPGGPNLSPRFDEPEPSVLPGAGEDFGTEDYQLDDRNVSGGSNPLVVPSDASLVVPSRAWGPGQCTGNLRAVLHFENADPRAMIRTLTTSLDSLPTTSVSRDGLDVLFMKTTSTGGPYLELVLVPTSETSGYVRIADCGD